jgi:glutamate dehydrogenase/leucine dehydrogenase
MAGILTPHLQVVRDGDQVLGFVAIDTTVRGRALGGLRLAPDVTAEEVAGLARAMTLKYGLAGLPQGGAKAGVLGDPDAPEGERRARLQAFARAIAPLLKDRVYQPDTDMGTRAEDIHDMLETVGLQIGRRALRSDRSGHYTALTVMAGARAALSRQGARLENATAAIEGFGAVGGSLATLLDDAGARVVAISTSRGALHDPRGLDVARLKQLAARHGSGVVLEYRDAERITPEALRELSVDLLSPCARPGSIGAASAARVRARAISSGANDPIEPGAEGILADRGVAVVPDFVANVGGVLGGTMRFAAVGERRIEAFLLTSVGAWIEALLARAEEEGVPTRQLAVLLARARFDALRLRAEHPGFGGRLMDVVVELHRRRLLPRPLVGAFAPRWFENALAPPPGPAGAR